MASIFSPTEHQFARSPTVDVGRFKNPEMYVYNKTNAIRRKGLKAVDELDRMIRAPHLDGACAQAILEALLETAEGLRRDRDGILASDPSDMDETILEENNDV